jgi:signal transduction histidine kinase/ActR/RegA family two-component response regulator
MDFSLTPTLAERVPTSSERAFRRLLEKLPAAAYTCDCEGLITYYNRRAVSLWGREPTLNDPVDRFCGSFKMFTFEGVPIAHDQCWMARTLFENKEYNGEELLVERPDGTRVAVLAHANPLHDEDGDLRGAVNVLVDISDRKRAEQALREADRRKDQFLAILAHELRNPLAPIQNGLQLLRLDGESSETRAEACTMMERQVRQLVRLVDDLMDVSRITSNKLLLRKERVELAAVVLGAVESARPLIESLGHELIVTLPEQPVYLEADLTRLGQVFLNLLQNAAKYTERGGRIALTATCQRNHVVVTVSDTGIGIPPDMLPRVFDFFTQVERTIERSQGGLGIGLGLVRGLVEMHGGTIEAKSEGLGCGSEFVVRLPVLAHGKPERMPDQVNRTKASAAPRLKILVVDDNEDSAVSLGMVLEAMGNEVRTAHDGMAAVGIAAVFQPDVVFLDIGLPKLNGYDAARKMREQSWGERMLLVALTGWGQEEDKRRSAQSGFNLHMVKPVNPAAIEKLLAGLRRASP